MLSKDKDNEKVKITCLYERGKFSWESFLIRFTENLVLLQTGILFIDYIISTSEEDVGFPMNLWRKKEY